MFQSPTVSRSDVGEINREKQHKTELGLYTAIPETVKWDEKTK